MYEWMEEGEVGLWDVELQRTREIIFAYCVGSGERWEELHVYEYDIIGCGAIAFKCMLA